MLLLVLLIIPNECMKLRGDFFFFTFTGDVIFKLFPSFFRSMIADLCHSLKCLKYFALVKSALNLPHIWPLKILYFNNSRCHQVLSQCGW